MEKPAKIILGIDPGTVVMGYGVIAITGGKPVLLEMSILKLSAKLDQYQRLEAIHFKVTELISRFHPDCFAIEAPFFGKNVQSMLKLGRAQGVAIAAALSRDIPIFEYAPRKIKMAITGKGSSSKEQVAAMLMQLLAMKELPKFLDATDGLAVALCHHFQLKPTRFGSSNNGSWQSFVSKNPGRVG